MKCAFYCTWQFFDATFPTMGGALKSAVGGCLSAGSNVGLSTLFLCYLKLAPLISDIPASSKKTYDTKTGISKNVNQLLSLLNLPDVN